ncbi:MAG: protein kinase, partial [Planctomycetota bacterium]
MAGLAIIRDGAGGDAELERHLRSLAHVSVVRLGPQALEALAQAPPGLIVLDVPRGSAALLDFIPQIVGRLSAFTPAVLAVIDPEDGVLMERAFAQGARDVLQRPVAEPLLRAKVQQNIRKPEISTSAIGGYSILRVLGRGGMGTVYLAERDGQRYALKVLAAGASNDAESLARFRREMDCLRNLRGPGIQRFFEAGRTTDSFFYVMEYVPGETLSDVIARGPADDATLRKVIVDMASALQAIHATQLIHRDVKPGNIIVATDGRATLIDYGLAKFAADFSLTRRDEVMGTILYMAPEIIRGQEPGPPSDAFSLGMTALHAALGYAPLDGTAAHVARRIMVGDVPRATGRASGLSV